MAPLDAVALRVPCGLARAHCRVIATSFRLENRASGSFARQVRMMWSSAGGRFGCVANSEGVSPRTIAPISPGVLAASKARFPVNISKSVAPNANTSVRASATCPSICSGAMYGNVPSTTPACVSDTVRVPAGAGGVSVSPARDARETEVQHFGAGGRQHHVARLEIAMDDARPMRAVEGLCDLDSACERFVQRQWPPPKAGRQGFTLDKLQHQIVDAGLRADIVDGADVRMAQCRDGARLALKPLSPVAVTRAIAADHLDRDVAAQACVAGAEHLAHAPCTQRANQFIRAEPDTGIERHDCGIANYTTVVHRRRSHDGLSPIGAPAGIGAAVSRIEKN